MGRVTAIFDDRVEAERAIGELRRRGIPDAKMSVIARRPDDWEVTKVHHEDTKGERIGKGAITGAAAAGAIVGGTAGTLASLFANAGYSKEEVEFYAPAVERGGVRLEGMR